MLKYQYIINEINTLRKNNSGYHRDYLKYNDVKKIMDEINEYFNSGKKFQSPEHFNLCFKMLHEVSNNENIVDMYIILVKQIDPSFGNIVKINFYNLFTTTFIKNKNAYNNFFRLLFEKNIHVPLGSIYNSIEKYENEFIETIINYNKYDEIELKNFPINNEIYFCKICDLNEIIPDNKFLEFILNIHLRQRSSKDCIQAIKAIISKNHNVKITASSFERLCKYSFYYNILKIILRGASRPTNKIFNLACKKQNIELITILIPFIKPTKEHLENYIDKNISNHDANKLIELFVANGYPITYEDVLLFLAHKLHIENIERFNIVLPQSFTFECHKYNYYPYKHINTDLGIIGILEACKIENNHDNIVTLSKNSKLCLLILYEALKLQNLETIKFIIENGIIPDQDCLESLCFSNNPQKLEIQRYLFNIFDFKIIRK